MLIKRCLNYKHATVLIYDRTDSGLYHKFVIDYADGIVAVVLLMS
jgi:hypothetical protein